MTDLKFAFRQLLKSPGFTTAALLTLAFGIAGNILMFSLFNGLYLRPLPFHDPERLVNLDEVAPKWNLEYTGLAYPDLCEWRAQNKTFESMGAWDDERFNFSVQGNPQRIEGGRATHDLFKVLGIQPILGRTFTPEEDQPGAVRVALIGCRFWKSFWAGASNVVGQTISLDSVPHTVVGVLPRDIGPLERADVVTPLRLSPNDSSGWFLSGIGRLKPGATLEAARQDLTRIHKALIPARPVNETTSPRLTPEVERLLGDYRSPIYLVMCAVGVVWLIACGNIAALMLARGLRRSKEISVRMALGASRVRVIRQVLVESLVLSLLSGLLGILFGQALLKLALRLLPEQVPAWLHFGIDWRIVLFLLVSTILTALLFGLVPALQMASNVDLQQALQSGTTRATGSAGHRRSLNALVVAEIALALVLLVGAGLLLQAFRALQKSDPGFRPDNVLTYNLALPGAKYTNFHRVAFFEEHLANLRALPGTKAVSAITLPPLEGHSGTFFKIENAPPKAKDEKDPVVLQRHAFPGYVEAMGLTLLAGRFISEQDTRTNSPPVVVVNETFARRAWPGQDPIGKRIAYPAETAPWMTVIGLVKDIKHYGFDRPMRPGVYLPYHQGPSTVMTIVLRSAVEPKALVPTIQALLQKIDPDLPMFRIKTMSERVRESLWLRKSYSSLLGFFASIALTMSLAGIYGVISYAVSQRTNEIGIRIALGAQRWDVLALILRQAAMLAGAGISVGLITSIGVTRFMRTLLYGVSATEPVIFLGVSLALAAVTLLACLLPARRAATVDPMEALRYE